MMYLYMYILYNCKYYDVFIHVYTVCIYIHYVVVVCRLVHSFTCAGILPAQYIKFCEFGGMGHVGHRYMKRSK